MRRREFIASGALAAGALLYPGGLRRALAAPARAGASPYGPLVGPDANGLMLPQGFTLAPDSPQPRDGARHLLPVPGLPRRAGDLPHRRRRLDPRDQLGVPRAPPAPAPRRCASAPTARWSMPTGSWATRTRTAPAGRRRGARGCPARRWTAGWSGSATRPACWPRSARPALGVFNHEAAAVDPVGGRLYLTEDEGDGRFYRFTPRAYPSLADGVLEVAVVGPDARVSWRRLPDPTTAESGVPTRAQVPGATRFRGGEGIWYARDVLYFTTKGDRKVWAYDARERAHRRPLRPRAGHGLRARRGRQRDGHGLRRRVRVRGRRQPGDRPDLLEPRGRPLPALRGRRLRAVGGMRRRASTPRARASTRPRSGPTRSRPASPAPAASSRSPVPSTSPVAASPPTSCSGRRPARCGRAGRSTPVPTAPARD